MSDDPTTYLDLLELEHWAFGPLLAMGCDGCPWTRTEQGAIPATIAAQAHQDLHALLGPNVPGVSLAPGGMDSPGWPHPGGVHREHAQPNDRRRRCGASSCAAKRSGRGGPFPQHDPISLGARHDPTQA
ncbi:hypothetical protein N865_19665 [Intrasporangium oryzae NRRL B-24470]|uniref:Uncharacterized protein n=1 Tax=Intrasporangium oryzae NRRL B-24470 TaxID=1386089 RepID=W9G7U7_9MICO|nr:hypothetical protein N865_19665 [Intrasporangium oryzae NRRL B-24470]